ncbi:MAG TPA: STAS domain-containing protein [Mycobacteriales bacterium]|nr:STAS domain-containing protein [Mycobacteriales bacterium]
MTAQISVGHDRDVVTAQVFGDVDLTATPVISAEVLEAMQDASGLVLDLTGVRYLDSAGVHMIFELARQLTLGRQGMALLLQPSSTLHRLVQITGLAEVVAVCSAQQDCENALREANHA